MKVLIYGGGAREHALAWKISNSPLLTELYLAHPNDGFKDLGTEIQALNNVDLAVKARDLGVNLLIVGPETPLMEGLVDVFAQAGIPSIGPDRKWAYLEGSKSIAKKFMVRNNIPTARYNIVTDVDEINTSLDDFDTPIVLKADGLAAGKGVAIVETKDEATRQLKEFLTGKYGEASHKVVIEEFLDGQELSLIALWDGKTLLPLIPARDYKKLLEGNQGPNTGGMGSFCPVELTDIENKMLNDYINRLKQALIREKANFTGVIYSGLIFTQAGLKVLEYNMRFGDPETQPLLMHMKTDLLYVFDMARQQKLDSVQLEWNDGISFCLVIAAQGYPENPTKGGELVNINEIESMRKVKVFYAGVKNTCNKLIATGGRVLSICKTGKHPQNDVYRAASELSYKHKYYRTDIGI
jgi:phosphoribosylamine--glycine ligase